VAWLAKECGVDDDSEYGVDDYFRSHACTHGGVTALVIHSNLSPTFYERGSSLFNQRIE
jgi:hypothetical protein